MDEQIITRAQPNSIEIEQSVISSMMKSTDAIVIAEEMLQKDDFYHAEYALLFDTLIKIKNEIGKVDLPTLLDYLRRQKAPANVADAAFLNEIAELVPFTSDIALHADIVRQKSLLRQIIKMNQAIQDLCYNQSASVDEILDQIEQNWLAVLKAKGTTEFDSTLEIARQTLEEIKQAYLRKGSVSGLSTGYMDLDHLTNGLQPSDLILIAARPAMGKTAFALNIAKNVALDQDKAVIVFSLEMSNTELMKRFFSMESKIDARRLTAGNFSEEEYKEIIRTTGIMGNAKLILEERSNTISDIKSKCRKASKEQDIQLIIIDYLQLVSANRRIESRQLEVAEISRALKGLARELKVPVIALSQLSRAVEQRENKRPMLSDLRESGAIEQDADIVMFLYRDEYYNKDTDKKGVSEVIVAKQRKGPVGSVELKWIEENTLFRNLLNPRNTVRED